MVDLQKSTAALKAKGLGLAVITYDTPALLAAFIRTRGITFTLLSDPGSRTIRGYGLLNTTVEPSSSSFGIPFPGTFMLNRAGVVTARFFEEAYQERTTVSNIMVTLGGTDRPTAAQRVTTDHLEVTSYVTDNDVAPGSLFSVVFDVRPREKMHVYAPGATGYRVVGIRLDPNPLLVIHPTVYPPSETYFFAPLNERVPIYQKPFRLTRSLAISAAQEHRDAVGRLTTMTVKGALDYQACDDRICYPPKSIPVSFAVTVRQLDRDPAAGRPAAPARP